jgi:phosphohistidine phosphatase SixA
LRFITLPRVLAVLCLLLLAGVIGLTYCYLRPVTTVILVRHAEKKIEPNNSDPDLSPEGEARARELVRVLGNAGVTAIYTTQYRRTQQTVKPLADRLSLPITQVESNNTNEVVRQIKVNHAGGVVLHAGHSNRVPAIIAGLGGGNYPDIPDSDYDDMFVVTLYRYGKASTVRIKYGSAAPATGNQQMLVQP